MKTAAPAPSELEAELRDLRARLAETEEALRAIRTGNVDAVLVTSEQGDQVYSRRGADLVFRRLVETMSQGALTLSANGVILYGNAYLAGMLGQPLDRLLGSSLRDYLPRGDEPAMDELLAAARTGSSRREVSLQAASGRRVPVHLLASRLESEGSEMVFCLLLTDLTEQRSHEQVVAAERLARQILEQAAEAIVVCDERGHVIRSSQAAQRFSEGSPLDRPFEEAFALRAGAFHLAHVLQGETVRDVDVTLERQGQELALILNAGPLMSGQQIFGCVVTLTDITERKRAEEAVRASEEDFRSLAEAMPQIVWITRPDGWNIYFSQHWMDYTGLTLEESLGEGWNRPFHPDDQQRAWEAWQKATRENGTYSLEARLRRADGEYRWWLVRGVPLLGATGTILKWYGTCTDIHGLKMAELEIVHANQVLRESERRFSEMLDRLDLISMMLDRDGRITYCNEHLLHLTGWQREDLIGKNWFEIFVPPELADLRGAFFTSLLANQAEAHHQENEILTRSGERRLVRFNNMVLRSLVGDVIGTASIGEDVTERKRAEKEIRLQSAALNAAADAIVITRRDGAIEWSNPAFSALTGYSGEEAVGKNPRELLKSGVQDPEIYRHLWETILGGKVWRGEMTNRRKDGSHYPEVQTITPVKDATGAVAHFIAIKRDLTEEKRLQAQLLQSQKMESVGRLAGGIAHDFNNLLTVINGTAEMSSMQLREADPLRHDLAQIRQAGERAALLTRQLLAFSRKQIMAVEVLSLGKLVADMQGMLQRLIGENIDLVVVPAQGADHVRADRAQLEQVVLNLVVNSRDAMAGGGALTIETRAVELDEAYTRRHPPAQAGPYVRLSVSDTGVGMDEATRAQMFEPFFTTKELGQGTGLGLSTVDGIVRQSGGSIEVYSEPGRGTTFKIYLPRVGEVEAAAQAQAANPVAETPASEIVFVVEDEKALRELAMRILKSAGYTVLTFGTAEEALPALTGHEGPVHLLLTDLILPGMTGRELAIRLKEVRPEIKVLYTSGYTDDAILRHGVLENASHFLGKPYSVAELKGKVREVLDL